MHSQWEEGQGTALFLLQPVLHRPRVGHGERRGRGALSHLRDLWAGSSMWQGWPAPCSKPPYLSPAAPSTVPSHCRTLQSLFPSEPESLEDPCNASCRLVTLPYAMQASQESLSQLSGTTARSL